VHRMRRFAIDLFTPAGVTVEFEARALESGDPQMTADLRRQMFLIFKEALHNAARHSQCTRIEIAFPLERGCHALSITDNGRGFDPGSVTRGHGLASLQQRAQQIGGRLTVDSAPGRGTSIHLRVPVHMSLIRRGKQAYMNM
jgi:signal transduction histidine kinase